jgi:hypothetical protein
MTWYRSSCGFTSEATPRRGRSIVSVSHLHRGERVDGTSSIVRMEEVPDPAVDGEATSARGNRTAPGALFLTSRLSVSGRTRVGSRPERRVA